MRLRKPAILCLIVLLSIGPTSWNPASISDFVEIDSPCDITYEEGTEGHEIVWDPDALNPDKYIVYMNDSTMDSGDWNGSSVETDVDGLSPAFYNYTLFVNDTVGNFAVDQVYVNVSISAPPIVSDSKDFAFELGSIGNSVRWNVSDQSPHRYTIYRNETAWRFGSWSIWNPIIYWYIDGLPIGLWNFTLFVNDTLGNWASDTIWVTSQDTLNPAFILPPDDFSYECGTTGHVVTWNNLDGTPYYYDILYNGVLVKTGSWNMSSEPIQHNVDGLSLGIHNFTAVLYDQVGHSNSNDVLVTVVDTTAPAIIGPEDIEFEEGEAGYSVSWSGTDDRPSSYEVYRNGTPLTSGFWNSSSEFISVSLTGITTGVYNYTIVLVDSSGNSASDVVIVTVSDASTTTTTLDTITTTQTTTTSTIPPTDGSPLNEQTVPIVAAALIAIVVILAAIIRRR